MNTLLFLLLSAFLTGNNDDPYNEAEKQANLILFLSHEEIDSFSVCEGRMKLIVLKDTVLNKPGCIGTEYNYPLYQFKTEIVYYKNRKIASLEKMQIQLKRYEREGVTTGIQIITIPDPLNTFYFDPEQHLITHDQFLELRDKICKNN